MCALVSAIRLWRWRACRYRLLHVKASARLAQIVPASNNRRRHRSGDRRLGAQHPQNHNIGFSTAAAKSCGMRSAGSSTSRRSSALAPVVRWGDGSPARSPLPRILRDCAIACPHPAPEVLRRLGAIVVLLPGGEIVPALKSGAIDASEWNGPWLDMAFGLHKAAGYYYHPGFHEPGTNLAVGINKAVWDSLDGSDRRVIEAMAACGIRALPGGVQREQRAVAAQAAGRRLRQNPQVRRLHSESIS